MFIRNKKEGLYYMVNKRTLVFISALVWLAAGFNVFRLGALEWAGHPSWLLLLLSAVIFVPFFFMFQRMAVKNPRRIVGMEAEKNLLFKFFTVKSYIIIAFMIALGITLRSIPAVPRFFIAFFYTGLGTALFLAGIRYLVELFRFKTRIAQSKRTELNP